MEQARLRAETAQYSAAEKAFKDVVETTSRYAMNDPDDYKWQQIGELSEIGTILDPYSKNKFTNWQRHYDQLNQAWIFYHSNLHGRAIVRNLAKFVLGKGPVVRPKDGNEKAMKAWEEFINFNKWSIKEKEMIIRAFRDGEVFIRYFVKPNEGILKIRFLRAQYIRNPNSEKYQMDGEVVTYGIGTDPEDVEDIKNYYRCTLEGNLIERIPAEEVTHIKMLADSDMKRGISFLLISMPRIKQYDNWLIDRIALNKVRSAIALIKKVEGTTATLESIRDEYKSDKYSSDMNKQKNLPAGTILTATKGITYEMLAPKINASDVKEDGRSMLLTVAAGSGMPEMMLTADYSNANYSSSMVAQNPFVREIEDWQDFFETYYREIYARVIRAKKELRKGFPENISEDCVIEWPPLILADIKKNNEAREIQHRNKIISKTTWQQKEALDPEQERENMTIEEDLDIYKGFNLPVSPVNQFGSADEDDKYYDEEELQE